jgi:hypothetical protein
MYMCIFLSNANQSTLVAFARKLADLEGKLFCRGHSSNGQKKGSEGNPIKETKHG